MLKPKFQRRKYMQYRANKNIPVEVHIYPSYNGLLNNQTPIIRKQIGLRKKPMLRIPNSPQQL